MVLAFQTDVTRVVTCMFGREGSEQKYRMIGVNEGHHELTHHRNDPEKIAKVRKINTYHIEQFAYLLGKLKSIPEGDGTLLDNCMIAYGSGNSDGNRHTHENLPILLAGKGGGIPQDRPARPLPEGDAGQQPLAGDARPDGRPDREPRRQHRGPQGALLTGNPAPRRALTPGAVILPLLPGERGGSPTAGARRPGLRAGADPTPLSAGRGSQSCGPLGREERSSSTDQRPDHRR